LWLIDLNTLSVSLKAASSVDIHFINCTVLWPICC
jgi:hypothetical protein